jgi:dolichol-phosphate mannosyltransferase
VKSLVVVATYNERENLATLAEAVLAKPFDLELVVIDDASPDGTGDLADVLARRDPRVHVIHRTGKLGLGTATIAGFHYACEHDYDAAVVMDADWSHHPRYLTEIVPRLASYDVVIGSRYVPGGGTRNWPAVRRAMSRWANLYTRFLLHMPVADASGAYRGYRTELLERVDFDAFYGTGYSFQEEMLYRAWRAGARITEVPIVFEDRTAGSSKISRRDIIEGALVVAKLAIWHP